MKKFILSFLLLPALAHAQRTHCTNRIPVGAGLTAGLSSRQTFVGEMYFALKPADHFVFYPLSIKVHSKLSDPTMPVIFETRAGLKTHDIELYTGLGYHFAGQDNKPEYRQYAGLKPAAGVIYHLTERLIVTAAVSGKVVTLQFGLFNVR